MGREVWNFLCGDINDLEIDYIYIDACPDGCRYIALVRAKLEYR